MRESLPVEESYMLDLMKERALVAASMQRLERVASIVAKVFAARARAMMVSAFHERMIFVSTSGETRWVERYSANLALPALILDTISDSGSWNCLA